MRTRAMSFVLLVACGGASDDVRRPRVGNAKLPVFPSSPWGKVFEFDAAFTLGNVASGGATQVLRAEVTDLRQVGDARVARLGWSTGPATGVQADVTLAAGAQPGPHQIVESPRGLAFFAAGTTDAQIEAALGSPDTWMFPMPSEARPELAGPEGQRARLGERDGAPLYCYSVEQPEPCAAGCAGEICVASEAGLVSVGGAWSPDGLLYEAAP